jgi:hypothetical protein
MTAVRRLTPAMRLAALVAIALGVLMFWLLAARHGHLAALHQTFYHGLKTFYHGRPLADGPAPLMHYHG